MSEPNRKKIILKKAERKLAAYIRNEESAQKVESAAETVRVSWLNFFKGQHVIAEYDISEGAKRHLSYIENNIKEWEAIDTNEIIEKYRNHDT